MTILARLIRFKYKRHSFNKKNKKSIFTFGKTKERQIFQYRINYLRKLHRKHSFNKKNKKSIFTFGKTKERQIFQYRINYRQMYKNNLVFLTNFKLKHLIQDLVQHYFAIPMHLKLS